MSNVARAIEQAAASTVHENLWWDSHESLFYDLDKFVSSRPKEPDNGLVQKLQVNHGWLLDMLLQFKPPSARSRSALDVAKVFLGGHTLEINDDMKKLALQLSETLMLDEVQTYLLVSKNTTAETPFGNPDLAQKIILNYYMERQCLLKCTRLLLLFHVADPSDMIVVEPIDHVVKELVKNGFENKVYTLLQRLLCVEQPLHLDPMFHNLWAEEVVIEQTLVMDILFLLYYEPLCSCSFVRWKELFLMFQEKIFTTTTVEKLLATDEGVDLAHHVKYQGVLILLEALDLEEILQMVFDEEAFRLGRHPFSAEELRQIDGLFASLSPMDAEEYAPLLLGWATFGCLLSCLPADEKGLEIDHSAYILQAYEGGALKYLLHRLHRQGFQDLDAQIDGYKCVIKSLLSSFIAAYDIAYQEDSLILENLIEILYTIYSEQELLCVEFWDRESVLDGPIQNLLFSFRECFPYQLQPLVRLLAGLSVGPWPGECVYDFLYSMVDVTSFYQNNPNISFTADGKILHTKTALQVPGAVGLLIPVGTTGHIIRVISDNTCLVRWECKHSAIIILLFRLMDPGTAGHEIQTSLNLLCRMLSANKMLAELFMELDNSVACMAARSDGRMEGTARIDILNIICILLDKLLDVHGDISTAAICVDILGVFASCCPTKVMSELSRSMFWKPTSSMTNFLDEGLLAKSISVMFRDSELFNGRHMLVVSVLELFTTLIGKGIQSEILTKMVGHVIGNIFVKHMMWKYNQKYECWKMFTKVFELASTIASTSLPKLLHLKTSVLELMMVDSYVHDAILKILSTTCQHLEEMSFNRLVGVKEMEWYEKALISGMVSLHHLLLSQLSSEDSSMVIQLEHTLLNHVTGAITFVNSVLSLTGFTRNQDLQVASIKMLGTLCILAQRAGPHSNIISSCIQGAEQRLALKEVFRILMSEEMAFSNLEIFNSAADLLITAARFQPFLVDLLFCPTRKIDGSFVNEARGFSKSSQPLKTQKQTLQNDFETSVLESVWNLLKQAQFLSESHPHILSSILFLLKSLWQGGIEFPEVLEAFRSREGFWEFLTACISGHGSVSKGDIMNTDKMLKKAFQYQCQTSSLQILACEFFFQQFTALHIGANSTTQGSNADVVHSGPNTDISSQDLPFIQWIKSVQRSEVVHSFVSSSYDSTILSRAKAVLRALLVGLMLKVLMDDILGISAPMIEFLQESLKAVLDHPSFQELLNYYSSQGYGHGKELPVLLLSDLYYHLQGELEAGRNIPAGSFQHLVKFIDTIDLASLLYPNKHICIEGFNTTLSDNFSYDIIHLGHHLGREWWSHTDSHILVTAESALNALQHANGMACLVSSQLLALESFINLLVLSSSNKQVIGAGLVPRKHKWMDSCIMELCDALKSSAESLSSTGDSVQYVSKFLEGQSQLLLVSIESFSNCLAEDFSKVQVDLICTKVVMVIVICMRSISGSLLLIQFEQKLLVKNLLGAFLVCLELLKIVIDNGNLREEMDLKHEEQGNQGGFVDVALISMEFLPMLCSFVEIKEYANLAIASIGVLVKQFLAPLTWLPILQKHFPFHFALSLLQMDEGADTAHQVLHLFLLISQVRGGAELLQLSGFFSHIMLLSEQLKDKVSYFTGDMEGPFCAWKRRTKKSELWGLCVAIVSAIVQSLSDKDGSTALDNALVFFESQKEWMLCALKSPCVTDADGNKRARFQCPHMTISALQETQQVLHLMVKLVCHHQQWSIALGRSATEFRKACIHLLAYIAREGITSNINGVGTYLQCPPMKNEEMLAHKKASKIGCSVGWFAVTAKGSSANTYNDTGLGFRNAEVLNEISHLSGFCEGGTVLSERDASVPTQYSDYVALDVYKLEFLLLEFLCKQVLHALKGSEHGGPINYSIMPEFPAPEILYGLQDQVMSVITDICSKRSRTSVEQDAQETCCILLSIMEKALFLEICVSRLCGIGPLSLRSEDFLKEYKSLVAAIEGQQFLVTPMKSLKVIIGLAHPTFF